MNIKVRELLKQVKRMELAAKHGLDITRDPVPGIPAEKTISAEQCEWTLKDCVLFRSAICRAFGVIPAEDTATTETSAGCVVETMLVEKVLFKELLQLVLKLPDLGSELATVDVDYGTASTSKIFVRLEPTDFLLRLNASLRACG